MSLTGRLVAVQSTSAAPIHRKRSLIHSFLFIAVVILILSQSSSISRGCQWKGAHRLRDGSVEKFVRDAEDMVLSTFNSTSLHRYCSDVQWKPATAIDCGRIYGDIGDMRQSVLSCSRAAIDSQAGLILPKVTRGFEGIGDGNSSLALDHVFNQSLLASRLQQACPKMPLYESRHAAVEQGVAILELAKQDSIEHPLCPDPYLDDLVAFSAPLYDLAFTALFNLQTKYHLTIHPYHNSTTPKASYLAVHLSASGIGTGTANGTIASYRSKLHYYSSLVSWGLFSPVIYVASSSSLAVRQFGSISARLAPAMKVVTISDLLVGKGKGVEADRMRQRLKDLTQLQREVLDYVLLENAAYFVGEADSTVTWDIVMRRAGRRGVDLVDCKVRRGPASRRGDWRDGWSEVVDSQKRIGESEDV